MLFMYFKSFDKKLYSSYVIGMDVNSGLNILSFQPTKPNLRGGHRPFNLDMALKKESADVEVIEDFLPYRLRPGSVKILSSDQQDKRKQLQNFIDEKKENKWYLVHGIQQKTFMERLKRTGIPIALDFRDDPILQYQSTLNYDDRYSIPISEKKIRSAEINIRESQELSDLILFPSETLMKKYDDHIVEKGMTCMNASDPNHFIHSELPDNLNIGILTGMQPIAGIETLLDGCVKVKKDHAELTVEIGTSDSPIPGYEEYIHKKYSKFNWIKFSKDVFYENAPDFFKNAYLSVNLMPKTDYLDACTPLKLFDTMAAGRPIIATNLIETMKIIGEESCGLICENNVEDFADKLSILLSDREMAEKLGHNGRKAIEEKHSWNHRARDIIEALKS